MGWFSSSGGNVSALGLAQRKAPKSLLESLHQAGTLRSFEVGVTLTEASSPSVAYSSWKKTTSSFCLT